MTMIYIMATRMRKNMEGGVNGYPCTLGVFGVVEGPDDGMRNDWKKLSDE